MRLESLIDSLRPRVAHLADDPVFTEVIKVGFAGNPRRIRRFISTFNLTVTMLTRSGSQSVERMRQVAILLMFRQEHPDFFSALIRDHNTWNAYTHLLEDDPSLGPTKQALEPPRPGIDLPPKPPPALVQLLNEVIVLGDVEPVDG